MIYRESLLEPGDLVAGVDTHADTHTVAVLTGQGVVTATRTFSADRAGYQGMIAMLGEVGHVGAVGVEGTASYGSGLCRALQRAGFLVKEVLRPARQVRRMSGKSDPIDAVEAARTVLSGRGIGEPKDTTGPGEALRYLLAARSQLVTTMTALANVVTSMLVTAPEPLREKYRHLPTPTVMRQLALSRPTGDIDHPGVAMVYAARDLARAYRDAHAKAGELLEQISAILTKHYPAVLAIYGAGPVTSAQLVVTTGGNPDRIHSEAAMASLCGAAPIPASSGKTTRYRLNRGGDRRGNAALHRIVLVRMQRDKRTQDYVQRRRRDGKNTREIMRCLKRFIAREVYHALTRPQPPAPARGTELRALRQARQVTQAQAAAALAVASARISDLELGRRPLPALATRYKQWLTTT